METRLELYATVCIRALLQSEDDYDGWGINVCPPRIGDTGAILEVLTTPGSLNKYVVENVNSDGTTIWLSDFFAEEIEPA